MSILTIRNLSQKLKRAANRLEMDVDSSMERKHMAGL